jgi:hypothetical protein
VRRVPRHSALISPRDPPRTIRGRARAPLVSAESRRSLARRGIRSSGFNVEQVLRAAAASLVLDECREAYGRHAIVELDSAAPRFRERHSVNGVENINAERLYAERNKRAGSAR